MSSYLDFIYIPLCIYFNMKANNLNSTLIYDLHSTMYLFQLKYFQHVRRWIKIYIPLCIYFNSFLSARLLALETIYIPLCIYFNFPYILSVP